MFSLILKWCEYVFPERQSHKLVRLATPENFLSLLAPVAHTDFVSLLSFKEPLVRAAIHEAKFKGNAKAWTLLSLALAQYLKHQGGRSVLLPIPLSANRKRKRGYNQVLEVARRALSEVPHVELNTHVLYRTRDTTPQTSLSRVDRLKNLENAFCLHAGNNLRGQHVIILDDVVTTGATLQAARAALKPIQPASITLLALAH